MCGIEVALCESSCDDEASASAQQSRQLLQNRGPDHFGQEIINVGRWNMSIKATVLHIRGPQLVEQPVTLSNNAMFCWNGEAYQIADLELTDETSDTQVIAQLLEEALSETNENCIDDHEEPRFETTIALASTNAEGSMLENQGTYSILKQIGGVMGRIWNGEYAFCLATQNALYFGRDTWGRRSLVVFNDARKWTLASVASQCGKGWEEVAPGRVYELNLDNGHIHSVSIPSGPARIPKAEPWPCPPCGVSASMWRASFVLQEQLTLAVQRRISHSPSIGILFSGGLDSVVLAALALQFVDLHLFNVHFGSDESPKGDRKAALESFEELKLLHPKRKIQMHCINVEWDEVLANESHVRQLILPKHTVMDLNIGTALWFAASRATQMNVRILLVGMGADEQMAGYGRHRTCFNHKGYEGLQEELQMDLDRLWQRNLGRDDRIISDCGTEARFPYLDPNVVALLQSLPLDQKCNMNEPAGVGDKQVLRLVAQRLNLTKAGGLVKRAIQFGSRMAHMSDKRRFSSRTKASGEASIPDVF